MDSRVLTCRLSNYSFAHSLT